MKYLRQVLDRIPWRRRFKIGVWGNATEAVFSVSLVGIGLIVLVWCIVTQWLSGAASTQNELIQRILGMVFSGAIIGLGGFRLVRVMYASSGSPEHRSQFLQQALDLDYLRSSEPIATSAPSVPQLPPGRLAAGQRLRFRINQSTPSRGRLSGLVAFALLMLGVSTVLVAVISEQWEVLPLDRLLMTATVLIVLVSVTVWLLWKTGRSLIEQFQLGLTRIELSGHPISPGVDYQLFFQQTGEIRLEKLDLVLQCFEQTTYEQGTDICTHRETTYEQMLVETTGVQLSAEEPRYSLELRLPECAMHSFLSDNNQIGWQLVVKGKKKGCPEFRRDFPILVFPKSVGRS